MNLGALFGQDSFNANAYNPGQSNYTLPGMAQALSTSGSGYGQALQQSGQENTAATNYQNMLTTQANGGGASAAEMQAKRAGQSSLAQNLALQASSRGNGQNLGQSEKNTQNAAVSGANQIAAQGADLRASQTLNAQGQLGSFIGNEQNQANNMAQYYNNATNDINQNQAGLSASYGQQLSNNFNSAQGINAGISENNANNAGKMFGGIIGGLGTALTTVSDENKKTDISNAKGKSSSNNFLNSLGKILGSKTPNGQMMAGSGTQETGTAIGAGVGLGLKSLFRSNTDNNDSNAPVNNNGMGNNFSQAGSYSSLNAPTLDGKEQVQPKSDYDLTNESSPLQFNQPNQSPASWNLGIGNYFGNTTSDKNKKTDISNKNDMKTSFLDKLTPYSYKYKNPNEPGAGQGQHLGVMAQDLEKTDAGNQAVKDTPNGKQVDYGQLASAMLASQVQLNQRLKKLEQRK
jgi:hypothetical protein